MRVLELTASGPDGLRYGERPVPVPGPGEALLRVTAAALNYRDLAIVRGEYGAGYRLPLVLGSDGSGEVVALGPGATRRKVGERVVVNYVLDWVAGEASEERAARRLGGPTDGTLAEYLVVPEHALVPLPPAVDDATAATLPVAGVTAYRGLYRVARVSPGDTVVVHGTGGVSSFAIALAAAAGARVIAVSGSAAKLARAEALGARAGIDRSSERDWAARVRELTGGRGADVVFDVVGGDMLAQSVEALRVCGVLLVVGFVGGARAAVDVRALLRKVMTVHALSAGSREDLEGLVRLVAAGALRPAVARAVAWDEARAALLALDAGGHVGKVVVRVAGR